MDDGVGAPGAPVVERGVEAAGEEVGDDGEDVVPLHAAITPSVAAARTAAGALTRPVSGSGATAVAPVHGARTRAFVRGKHEAGHRAILDR